MKNLLKSMQEKDLIGKHEHKYLHRNFGSITQEVFATGNKAPVTSKSLEAWSTKCRELANYMFGLKDEKGNFLWNGRRKTVIWGFSFSLHSVASICKELLTCKYLP